MQVAGTGYQRGFRGEGIQVSLCVHTECPKHNVDPASALGCLASLPFPALTDHGYTTPLPLF